MQLIFNFKKIDRLVNALIYVYILMTLPIIFEYSLQILS